MKVQVAIQFSGASHARTDLEVVAGVSETVASFKGRVTSLEFIPFPQQAIVFQGKSLDDDQVLAEAGVKEGSSLDFVVSASEDILAQQLTQLLQARDLSCDELGLLYCYKHGVSATQALKLLGYHGKLQQFAKSQKSMVLENGYVSLVRKDTSLQRFSVVDEVTAMLESEPSGSMDLKLLNANFIQKFNVSIASLVGTRPAEFFAREEQFAVSGRTVSLAGRSGSVPPEVLGPEATLGGVDNQKYLELYDKICSRSFTARVVQSLDAVCDVLAKPMFINVDHIVRGGSAGTGVAISGAVDAEVVLFLRGVPAVRHDLWLAPLLRALAGVLGESAGAGKAVETVRATEDSVQVRAQNVTVDVRLSSIFPTFDDALTVLGHQEPEARRHVFPSLAKERAEFITKQPAAVKVTICLFKWWRDQQQWSGRLMRPSDEVLEFVVIYSAVQSKPTDQSTAVANVMSLLTVFSSLRIVWSNFYRKDDIWAPLLHHRPLLMDPTNPFVNVADPVKFDPSELMQAARTTHFFW